jgi:putative hydrolase of the HAD superfamily
MAMAEGNNDLDLVFDLGGVVVRWEPEELIRAVFPDQGSHIAARRHILQHSDWVELDRGTLPLEDAIDRATGRSGFPRADVAKFFASIPEALVPVPETVDLLYRLHRQGRRLFCLSNMHLAAIEHLEKAYSFWDVFSGRVISCRLHVVKPEPAIYAHLLETFALNPANTVFIDDLDVNLRAAAQFGIRTVRFENAPQCEDDLKGLW